MSATSKFTYANGRLARLGDTVVNQHTGQKVVVTSLRPDSAFFANRAHYLHESDRKPMPRSQQARIARDFQ